MDFGAFTSALPSSAEAAAPAPAVVELDRKLYTMLEIEAKRYQSFFATLDEHQTGRLSRDVALAFYAKSSLSEQEITQLYALIKSLQLLADPLAVNETEFTTGMHFIVCMTKRSLAKLPPTFPTYLFPTLDLTPASAPASALVAASAISSMPSPDKDELQGRTVGAGVGPGVAVGFLAMSADAVASRDVVTPSASASLSEQVERLQDATSLRQLVERETHNKRAEVAALAQLDASESKALASLRSVLDRLADSVEALGYTVPASARALDALDDFGNLLRSHVQAAKQEVQSLEIAAQMLAATSATDARTSADMHSSSSHGSNGSHGAADPFRELAHMTQELVALQQQTAQLSTRKDELLAQVQAKKRNEATTTALASHSQPSDRTTQALATSAGAAAFASVASLPSTATPSVGGAWGDFVAPPTSHEVRGSETVESLGSGASGASASVAAPAAASTVASAPAAAVAPLSAVAAAPVVSDDFSWGDFS